MLCFFPHFFHHPYLFSSPLFPNQNKFTLEFFSHRQTRKRKHLISMAVESRHLNLFPPQFLLSREVMNAMEGNNNGMMYNTQIGYGIPMSGTTTVETLLPMYSSAMADSIPAPAKTTADSGLTYNLPVLSRKRSRDSINPSISIPPGGYKDVNRCNNNSMSFLGEDISFQIMQQQLDIDRFISQHMENLRMEIEERRKRHSRRILEAVEEGIMKRLRAREEEIDRIGKMNWALEERVKSLCLENQIWRDLAQTNEATANALRSNLEQVLAQVNEVGGQQAGMGLDEADDAESCCGSTGGGEGEEDQNEGRQMLAGNRGEMKNNNNNGMRCRNCGKEEACVLLLPCRHLCLCTGCGSTVHTCPICKSNKNASVHVIMS